MKAIDNKELILSLEELEKERGIKKEILLEAIETALVTAYKRNFDSLENVKVEMDRKTGATHVYSIKEVVKKANDDVMEISLKDAQKINKDLDRLFSLSSAFALDAYDIFSSNNSKRKREYKNKIMYNNLRTIIMNSGKKNKNIWWYWYWLWKVEKND